MRHRALLATIWVAGIILATSVAWNAVRLVAAQVTDRREAPLSADAVREELAQVATTTSTEPPTTALPAPPPTAPPAEPPSTAAPPPPADDGDTTGAAPSRSAPPPTRRPTSTAAPTTAGTPPPPPSTTAAVRPQATPTTNQPPQSTTTAPPAPQPQPQPQPQPTTTPTSVRAVSRTFTTQGGSVSVRCQGDRISLEYATPRDGFTVTVNDDGPDQVEVRFRSADHESRLQVVCSSGAPDGRVEEKQR